MTREEKALRREETARKRTGNRVAFWVLFFLFALSILAIGGPLLLGGWLFFLVPAGLVAAACWIGGRERVHWFSWEYSILFVPFLVWALLCLLRGEGKSMSNIGAEPLRFGACVALSLLIRCAFGKFRMEWVLSLLLYLACCFHAVYTWHVTPGLPE